MLNLGPVFSEIWKILTPSSAQAELRKKVALFRLVLR